MDVRSLLSDNDNSTVSHRVRRLPYHHIHQYHRRQYLLRPVAIEFFDTDGTNFLFAFTNQYVSLLYLSLSIFSF